MAMLTGEKTGELLDGGRFNEDMNPSRRSEIKYILIVGLRLH